MTTRRRFLQTTTAAGLETLGSGSAKSVDDREGTTFILVADTHYSSVDEEHPASHAMVNAINRIADGTTSWPARLDGRATGFSTSGDIIAAPVGIVHLGDMTDHGSLRELDGGKGFLGLKNYFGYRQFWEHDGSGTPRVKYPNVIGICHGHSHGTGKYVEGKLRVIRCNNMGWEIDRGNKDGHGSFALVHATATRFDLVHVDCKAADGSFAFRPRHHFSLRLG